MMALHLCVNPKPDYYVDDIQIICLFVYAGRQFIHIKNSDYLQHPR